MKLEVKIGIIGMGSRGCACFGKLLSERKDSKITAICDINPVRLEAAAADLDHPKTYLKAEDMLKEEKLDAVIITVPDFLHEEMAILGLESNVNVLIDKPLATTAAGCKRIMAAAAKSKKTIMIGFNLR
ncbi:MAG: Gfo/Idh/MocA family oxidoreductase, partial [Lentisphaeria bacterium]